MPEEPDLGNIGDSVNVLRMLIGDTNEPHIVTDEVLGSLLDTFGSVRAAVIPGLHIVAAHFSSMADKTVGRLSISYTNQFRQVLDLIGVYEKANNANTRKKPGVVVLMGGGPKLFEDDNRLTDQRI